MIYFIDRSISVEFSTRTPNEEEYIFFQDLANSYQHGYCYLCGDLTSLKFLHAHLDRNTGNIYNTVLGHYSESGAAMNIVQQVFVLTYRANSDISSLPNVLKERNKCHFIYIPTAIHENWKLHTECCLLTENLEDSKFYLYIAKYYCKERKIPYQVSFHRENGGGNTICDVLEKCVLQEKMPTLCLVDSDQKYDTTKAYPSQPAKGTTLINAKKIVNKLLKNRNVPPYLLFPLYVHEVENLIPFQLLDEIEKEQNLNMLGLNRVTQLRQIKDGEPLLYYDFKNGFPYIKDKPQREYWKEIILELGGEETSMPPTDKLVPGTYQPELLFFPPLNKQILKKVLKKIETTEQKGDVSVKLLKIDNYLIDVWNNIGLQMLTWGCANNPLRA